MAVNFVRRMKRDLLVPNWVGDPLGRLGCSLLGKLVTSWVEITTSANFVRCNKNT